MHEESTGRPNFGLQTPDHWLTILVAGHAMTSPVRMVKDLKSGSLSNLHIAQSDEAFRDPDMADLLRAVKAHSEAQIR